MRTRRGFGVILHAKNRLRFVPQSFNRPVIQIDPEASFTPENIYFRDDRVKQVFGIKILIHQPGRFAKPGMPADAEIELDSPR